MDATTVLLDSSLVSIKALNTPVLGKLASSPSKELEGVMWKKGEVVKNWKQRFAIVDSGSRSMFYFKDKKPQELSLGFVPLWDARVEQDSKVGTPRSRGIKSLLTVSAPFRRTFYLGFESEGQRDVFSRTMTKVRVAGRANDAMWMNSWWRLNISKTGQTECEWARFAAALARSLKVRLNLEMEATMCYVVNALHRKDLKQVPPLHVVTLASLVEFSYLFGTLADGLENLDGVLQALTACSRAYAEKMIVGAQAGTFVLYLASRPTAESLAVLGLVFMSNRSRMQHKYLFRDPVSARWYCELTDPAFQRLDHLVAWALGVEQTFARQTRLKLDELERIKAMVCSQQKQLVDRSLEAIPAPNARGSRPKMPSGTPLLPLERTPSLTKQRSAPVFDEIEELLGQQSSDEEAAVLERQRDSLMRYSVLEDGTEQDTTEMMMRNMYCVSCGIELDGSGKFATCTDCGHFLMDKMGGGSQVQWMQPSHTDESHASEDIKDLQYSFVRNSGLSQDDVEQYRSRENTRKMTLLGISQSVQSWSEEIKNSYDGK